MVCLQLIRTTDEKKLRAHPSCQHHDIHEGQTIKNLFCGSGLLGGIWASVQTELLTYRRIAEGDPWVSSRCSLDRLLMGLEEGVGAARLPFHEESMIKEFSVCGWFVGAEDPFCAHAEEVSNEYMMNMEDWNRTAFIDSTENRWEIWYL